MGRLAILTILAVLVSADVAAARTASFHHRTTGHVRMPHVRMPHARAPRLGGGSHRRGHKLRLSAAGIRPSAVGAPTQFVSLRTDDDQTSGWFQSDRDKQAGWGMTQGGTQLVAGLYQRPDQPDIPGPQIYHTPEGRGAAGLSLSVKLGQ